MPYVVHSPSVDSTPALLLLPAKVRRAVYVTYGILSVAGTGLTAYYGALPNLTVPDPVIGGLAVLGALAAPVSVLAASNVANTAPAEKEPVEWEDGRGDEGEAPSEIV